jgi:hypothetical protein
VKKLSLILMVLLALGFASLAQAQATRTWVSGVGDDVNPCSRTAPCKTFAGAISKTASPGIINCLDPGGFGAVTITKDITIDCTGPMGSILSSGVQGVIVNALTTHNVVLRAIDINGAGTTLGTNGVNIIAAKSVSMYDVHIANYSGSGIQMTNSANFVNLFLQNCQILNTTTTGLLLNNSGTGVAKVQAENTTIQGSGIGVRLQGPNAASVMTRCNISHATNVNFQADLATNFATFESCTISVGQSGLNMAGGSSARLSRCLVNGNTVNGLVGNTLCFSNNVISLNAGNNNCSSPLQAEQ